MISKLSQKKSLVNLFSKLLPKYHFYANIFSVSEFDKFSPYQSYDYAINLETRVKLNHGFLYRISKDELLL